MTKLFAALVAATVLAAPLAQAQSHRPPEPPRQEMRDDRRLPPRPPAVKRWKRGEVLPRNVSQRRLGPQDLRRYRLPEARRGQSWMQVGNQFLLIDPRGFILSAR